MTRKVGQRVAGRVVRVGSIGARRRALGERGFPATRLMGQDRRWRFNITGGAWGVSRGIWSVSRDLDRRRYGPCARLWQ